MTARRGEATIASTATPRGTFAIVEPSGIHPVCTPPEAASSVTVGGDETIGAADDEPIGSTTGGAVFADSRVQPRQTSSSATATCLVRGMTAPSVPR